MEQLLKGTYPIYLPRLQQKVKNFQPGKFSNLACKKLFEKFFSCEINNLAAIRPRPDAALAWCLRREAARSFENGPEGIVLKQVCQVPAIPPFLCFAPFSLCCL